jgi:hypothetical protein
MPITRNEQLQQLVNRYRAAGESWPATSAQIAEWAVQSKRWTLPHYTIIAQLTDQISRAMREEYKTDPQGRRVRAMHVARIVRNGKQMSLWVGMDDTTPGHHKHMRIAFQQRRQGIVGDCQQLKTDVDSYNENNNPEEPIQMVFDFTSDLEEAELIRDLTSESPVTIR